jgi:hypothetical protein
MVFARDPARVVGRQKERDWCDILWLTDSTERRRGLDLAFEVTLSQSGRAYALGLDRPGVICVDADLARAEFLCQYFRDGNCSQPIIAPRNSVFGRTASASFAGTYGMRSMT